MTYRTHSRFRTTCYTLLLLPQQLTSVCPDIAKVPPANFRAFPSQSLGNPFLRHPSAQRLPEAGNRSHDGCTKKAKANYPTQLFRADVRSYDGDTSWNDRRKVVSIRDGRFWYDPKNIAMISALSKSSIIAHGASM